MKINLRGTQIQTKNEPVMFILESMDEKEKIVADMIESVRNENLIFIPNKENFTCQELESLEVVDSDDLSWRDKWIRSVADFENYKKRVDRQTDELRQNSRKSLSLLNILIELEEELSLALGSIPQETRDGLEIIYDKMMKNLEILDIKPIDNSEYDPDIHEVVAMNESGERKIEKVLSKGWTLDGKTIKYPKVIINKNINHEN
jgi:molecular chaperone GrpE